MTPTLKLKIRTRLWSTAVCRYCSKITSNLRVKLTATQQSSSTIRNLKSRLYREIWLKIGGRWSSGLSNQTKLSNLKKWQNLCFCQMKCRFAHWFKSSQISKICSMCNLKWLINSWNRLSSKHRWHVASIKSNTVAKVGQLISQRILVNWQTPRSPQKLRTQSGRS